MANNLKIYCQQCGTGNVYTLQKPRFCQACGQTMGTARASAPTIPSAAVEEGEEHFETPIMDGLDFEADLVAGGGQTLGDIVNASDPNIAPRQRMSQSGPKVTPLSSDEIMAEFQKEAGTLRKK